MFRGWGVGLTVAEMGGRSWSDAPARGEVVERPTRLGEVLPVAERSEAEMALELGRGVAVEAELMAYKSELVLGLAAHRPDAAGSGAGAAGGGRHARGSDPGDE